MMFICAINSVFLIGILQWNILELWASSISTNSGLEPGVSSSFIGSVRPAIGPYNHQDCPANLTFTYCTQRRSCDDLSSPLIGCVPACVCPKGYLFESSNSTNCIRMEQCKNLPACSSFEVYEQSGVDKKCPQEFNNVYPSEGCHCKKGYTRSNDFSMCKPDPCPACGPNEYYDPRGPIVRKTCENMYDYIRDYNHNEGGCYCTNEYVYDTAIRKCVKPEDCSTPPQCTGEHQVYVENGNWTSCFNYKTGGDPMNSPSCLCEPGYVFNIQVHPNKCVAVSNCEVSDENQETRYPSCVKTCDNRQTSRCDSSKKIYSCKNGYVYENINSSKCIKEEDCPNPPVCLQPNQEFSYGKNTFCPTGELSTVYNYYSNDCFCKSGYTSNFTDNIHKCMPTSQCPGVECPANASLRVSSADRTCNDIANGLMPESNVTWYDCFCNEGYVRQHGDIKCVRPEDCLNLYVKLGCEENEEIIYSNMCEDTCDTFKPSGCQKYSSINSMGCGCKPGHVYENSSSRKCIPVINCPKPIDCGFNMVFKMNSTQDSCMDRNSLNLPLGGRGIGAESSLRDSVNGSSRTSIPFHKFGGPACYCIDGYINVDPFSQKCIPEDSCSKCGNNTEYVAQSGGCVRSCDDLHMSYTNQQNPKCRVSMEANTCQCSYPLIARSDTDPECVDMSYCSDVCTENEEFLEDAKVADCTSYLNNISNTYHGGKGCYCKEGYLRDMRTLKCISVDQCSGCNELEEYSPTNAEDTTCENWATLKNTFVDLTLTPLPENSGLTQGNCICRKGYTRNSENKCIPITDCPSPPPCGPNQEFKQTGQDKYCEGLNSTDLGAGPRCYCNSGYARNYKNECIPENDCPKCEQNDPNSVLSACVHCYDYCNGTRLCSWSCLGDCDCKPGFVYNENGTCIPSSGCSLTNVSPTYHLGAPYGG